MSVNMKVKLKWGKKIIKCGAEFNALDIQYFPIGCQWNVSAKFGQQRKWLKPVNTERTEIMGELRRLPSNRLVP